MGITSTHAARKEDQKPAAVPSVERHFPRWPRTMQTLPPRIALILAA